jgi:hypothetical protein
MVANCCVPGCKKKYRGSTKSNLLALNLETLNITKNCTKNVTNFWKWLKSHRHIEYVESIKVANMVVRVPNIFLSFCRELNASVLRYEIKLLKLK